MYRSVTVWIIGGILSTLAWTPGWAADKSKNAKKHPANRLAKESSPYLLMHSHNPVNWYPWGPEAFAKAKKEKKLIFLSIGYSSCYWCHVMERQSFANEKVAKIMNQHFVCIKVDREERPDIDTIYMTALNLLRDRGGWPLSMFLSAQGKPIIGFTYRPPDDKEIEGTKVLGFKSIMKLVMKWQKDEPKKLAEQANKLAEMTVDALARRGHGIVLVDLDRTLVKAAVEGIEEDFDKKYGGFGSAARMFRGPKFPKAPVLDFLLQEAARAKSAEAKRMLTVTLDAMALGGIYDQLGGGFHRYSTERTWTVPHFEKMLYDNAQLAEVYTRAYRLTKSSLYRRIVRETLGFVSRELTGPEGGFYSALDAETKGEEGRYYVWTDQEIRTILSNKSDAAFFRKVYRADKSYNFEAKYHIFTLPASLAEVVRAMKITEKEMVTRLAPLKEKMLQARSKRERPFLDRKILTAWNGQMIAGFARAGQFLQEPKYTQIAARAADFVWKTLRTSQGRLLRTYAARPNQKPRARLNAYLDDYAYLVHGLLCLHDATAEKKWLAQARRLTDVMIRFHSDRSATGFFPRNREHGGFFYTSSDHEKLFARAKDQFDGAQPSGNSVAIRNLVRLWIKTGEKRYRDLADLHLRSFAAALKQAPESLPTMLEALALMLEGKTKK